MPPITAPLRTHPAWVERTWSAREAGQRDPDSTRAQLMRHRGALANADADADAAALADGLVRIEAAVTRAATLLGQLADLPAPAPASEPGLRAQRAPAEIVTLAAVGPRGPVESEPGAGLPLSSVLEALSVVGAVRADAVRYLLNQTNAHESWPAIRAAVGGQLQLSPEPSARLTPAVLTSEQLSERELDVLRLLARGRSNKQIARELTIAENTVKTHVSSILGKLGVESRTQAALYAGRLGLLPPGEPAAPGPCAA
jgi:DNA-binding CsgD family transcriptional regulator